MPVLRSDWAPGDRVHVELPLGWRLERLVDTRPQYQGLHAVMMGPFLMAGEKRGGKSALRGFFKPSNTF